MIIIAGLAAILLPLLFLYIIYALDLYSSGSFRTVATCFGWGLLAFVIALFVNTGLRDLLLRDQLRMGPVQATATIVVLLAPIVEELVKSLVLIYFGRKPDFTYFVDGAIYGFAAGIAFSILENIWYLAQLQSASQAPLAVIARTFSTCLMHGSTSALVGVSIGRFRYGRGRARILSAILGWSVAVVLHSLFNRVAFLGTGPIQLLGTVGLGVGGVVLVALFIRWGLAEEKKWIDETLGLGMGVTDGEKALVRELHNVQDLLKPVKERFGRQKAAQVEEFLVKQAQLGIKQKSVQLATDPQLKQRILEQIGALQIEMEAIRRKVGVYCMTYVRTIFPSDSVALWSNLERLVGESQQRTPEFDLWSKLQATAESRMGDPSEDRV
jgi:RsiW-degrading membrane proteinase PrsW (M82 family)